MGGVVTLAVNARDVRNAIAPDSELLPTSAQAGIKLVGDPDRRKWPGGGRKTAARRRQNSGRYRFSPE